MNKAQKQRAEKLKSQLKQKMLTAEFVEKQIVGFKEIAEELENCASFKIIDLSSIPEGLEIQVKENAKNIDWLSRNSDIKEPGKVNRLISEILIRYPSVNPLRYVPDIPPIQIPFDRQEEALTYCVKKFGIKNQLVIIHFFRYSPIVSVELNELLGADLAKIFNTWNDVCLLYFENENQALVMDTEEEWYFLI